MDRADRATPDIAVIIPLVNPLPVVAECLDALAAERAGGTAEVIVVDRCGGQTRESIRRRFPWVRVLDADPTRSVPELRAMGVAASHAEIVAMIEDHCVVCPGWLGHVREGLRSEGASGYAAVGGPVENGAVTRIVDWAAFLCEYSGAMPPLADGEVRGLPGNNAAYRRSVLDEVGADSYGRLWEHFWHDEILKRGHKFRCQSEMVVYHNRPFGFAEYVRQRFHYSRSFAAMRGAREGRGRRAARAAATIVLPAVLILRIGGQILRKGRHLDKPVLSLPLLVPFTISWAVGELVGALFGQGHSLSQVR